VVIGALDCHNEAVSLTAGDIDASAQGRATAG
jgi:hypothetical protein